MSAADCTVKWCEADHETSRNPWSDHMGRVWHFDASGVAVSVWAGCREGEHRPALYLKVTNSEVIEEVVQNLTLAELTGLVALLSTAAGDLAFTLRWAEEARSLNLA